MAAPSMVAGLAPGDHACLAFDDEDSYLANAVDFIDDGLRAGHRVLCAVDDSRRDLVEPLFAGVDPAQLSFSPAANAYLTGGGFDTARLVALLRGEADRARADGWTALRVLGDMAWARGVVGGDVLADYEAHTNRVYAEGHALGMCLYDRRVFDPATLAAAVAAHPHTLRPDGGPLLRMRITDNARGLRLTGEIDHSNGAAVSAVVADLAAAHPSDGGPLTIDLSGLRFLDGATASMLIRTALRTPGGLRVVGANRVPRQVIELCAGGGPVPLDVEPARPAPLNGW